MGDDVLTVGAIIQQLRDGVDHDPDDVPRAETLMDDAATLIERQAADILALKANGECRLQELENAQAEIAAMKAKDWDLENDTLLRRLDEAHAEIARLREALRQIAYPSADDYDVPGLKARIARNALDAGDA